MMSIEYNVQCFCPGCDEGLDVNTSPVMFLPPFTLQIVQPGKRLPLSKVDCNRTCTISLLKDIWVCLFHMCVNMWVQYTGVCVCVRVDICLCVSVSHPGSLTFLFFSSHPHCICLNASVARLPTRTYADLLYKTFQLKIVAPPINLAPLSMCFSLVPIPVEKTKNGLCYVCPQREAVSHIHWPYL